MLRYATCSNTCFSFLQSIGINTCEPTKCEAGCDWFEKSEIETYTDESLIEDLISTMASYEKCYVDASEGFSKKQNSENQNYKTVSFCFFHFL